MLISGSIDKKISEFKEKMKMLLEMSDLGLLSSYQGIEVTHMKREIILSQRYYALKIISEYNMSNSTYLKPLLKPDLFFIKTKEIIK